MKNKDLQNIILSKYQKGDTPSEIHRDSKDRISLATTKRWCRWFINQLLGTRAVPPIVRALKRIYKNLKTVCTENRRYQPENFRGSSIFLRNNCQTNIKNRFRAQFLQKDNRELLLCNDQKIKRKQFANCLRTNFRKGRHLKNSVF